jgi:hypothetical protein
MNADFQDGDNATLRGVIAKGGGAETVIRNLYVAILARQPREDELGMMTSLASRSATPKAGYAAVQWVLLNSSEFALNH